MATDRTGIIGTVSRSGLTDSLVAIDASGDTFTNDGEVWGEFANGGGASTTVQAAYPNQVDGQTLPPKQVTIPAGERRKFGPFPKQLFNNGSGKVTITYSGNTASVTMGLFKLGK